MRDEIVRADIEQIRSSLVGLAERYAVGERSVLWKPINALREQLVCLLDEAGDQFGAELDYLVIRCEALARLVSN